LCAGTTNGVIFAAKVKNHAAQMNRFLTNFLSKTLLLGMPFDKAVFLSPAAAVFSEVGMSSVPH
jgi:hypothetical protein